MTYTLDDYLDDLWISNDEQDEFRHARELSGAPSLSQAQRKRMQEHHDKSVRRQQKKIKRPKVLESK